jgi:hypothetical protein
MKLNTTIFLLAILLFFSAPANSALIDRGTGMIYDTDQGITWLDYTKSADTWSTQTAWAESLVVEFNGKIYDDWRLPTTDENLISPSANSRGYEGPNENGLYDYVYGYNMTNSEMGYLFYDSLKNIGAQATDGTFPSGELGLVNTGPFQNLQAYEYWSATDYMDSTDRAWDFEFSNGRQDGQGKDGEAYALAVRDGDYGPSVSTDQSYLTDYILLGDTFSFDYWWEMETEPTDWNMDILFFNGTEWETFGWALNFDGSSDGWETASFWVPQWARGLEAQIRFSVFDLGQDTNPTVYLANIGSNSAPVPEPSTIVLMGLGLVGLAGFGRKKFKK